MFKKMPYFDYLLAAIDQGAEVVEKSFGQHVHWGYWEHPEQSLLTLEDFAVATENLAQLVYRAAKLQDNQVVLDVGCGFGGTLSSINRHFQAMTLLGLNIDERQLKRARQQTIAIGNNSLNFYQGNACALPFADNTFDAILAVECIFHFPSREQFFKEVHRVLKPDGYFAISDFLLSHYLTKCYNLPMTRYLTAGFFGTCDVRYTREKYQSLARANNFTVIAEQDITPNTLPTYPYLKSLLRHSDVAKSYPLKSKGLSFTILCIELLSRTQLLKYFVLAFQKS